MTFEILEGANMLSMSFDEPQWLVDGLIMAPSVNLLAGDAGTNKSWLAQTLALSLATGKDFLGLFPVRNPARVLYIQTESSKRGYVTRFQRLAKGLGVNPWDIPGKLDSVTNQPFMMDNSEHMDWVASVKPDLVIFDALRDFHGYEENSSSEMRPIIQALRWLRDEHGVSLKCTPGRRPPAKSTSG
ncbi:AAA family ATPase [Nitrolancea hollandica]|uniref:Uncharacterized protein n=1 Tax=Nitrolancea hollandica Lb TaxID=1129897 RepID=I4EEU7_9BACT|nr:AAA family ATPase [Nitrolancea hollandica]CCF83209.1 hypothetical protein NITHO_2030001 [Nitrolancea hollandica Lb]